MNRGLLRKTIRETRLMILLLAVALFLMEAVLSWILPNFQQQIGQQWLQIEFIQNVISALLGSDLGGQLSPAGFQSIAWVHPVALSLVFTHELVFCSRMPAGEIDRGTIDFLLGLPVSRWQAYFTESIVWLAGGAVIIGCGLLGRLAFQALEPTGEPLEIGRLLIVIANFYLLHCAVGGFSYFVSSLSDRRGRAIGIIFAVVLASFLLQFLTQFWEPARSLAFLGILNYYQPLPILTQGTWPIANMFTLSTVGACFWVAGGMVIARRDIRTV